MIEIKVRSLSPSASLERRASYKLSSLLRTLKKYGHIRVRNIGTWSVPNNRFILQLFVKFDKDGITPLSFFLVPLTLPLSYSGYVGQFRRTECAGELMTTKKSFITSTTLRFVEKSR
jgi:hypothetical protein